jgi:hypothetical protein
MVTLPGTPRCDSSGYLGASTLIGDATDTDTFAFHSARAHTCAFDDVRAHTCAFH